MVGYLATAEAQERIQQLASQLARFESFRHDRVTLSRITRYVTQFPTEIHEATIHWLEQLVLIDENDLERALASALAIDADAATQTFVIPFGGLGDSAVHLVYPIREGIARDRLRSLDDATIGEARRLVFFDDNVNTGKQVINVFAEWLGVRLPSEVDLGERHVLPLSSISQERLRERPIVFVFAVGTEGADVRVKELFREHLDMVNVEVRIGKILFARQKVFSGADSLFQDEQRLQLRDFVTAKGIQLLIAIGKKPEVAHAQCLGYGGAEAMVLFPYNVPTMTVTPLWLAGEVPGEEWMPLLERRRRRGGGHGEEA